MPYKEFKKNVGAYFPFEYLLDFLEFLNKNKDIIKVITYRDLPWRNDFDYLNNYPKEFARWRRQLNWGKKDRNIIYVLIQHDVDSYPERTLALLREEERLGIPSNVMIFKRRTDRYYYEKTGQLVFTDYDLDYNYLRRLEKEKGFTIGYHSNAFEQALFNKKKGFEIFKNDVEALRKNFNIFFISPHGGARNENGFSNNILPIPSSLKRSLRWVQNRHTVRFDGQYSDGGINLPGYKSLKERDLKDFVKTWESGKRYRVLIHPEYYHTSYIPSPRMTGTHWYDNLLEFYSDGHRGSIWEDVVLTETGDLSNSKPIQINPNFSFRHSLKKFVRKCCVWK